MAVYEWMWLALAGAVIGAAIGAAALSFFRRRERIEYRYYPASHQPATGPAPIPAEKAACPTTLYTHTVTARDYGAVVGLLIIAAVAVHYLRKGHHHVS